MQVAVIDYCLNQITTFDLPEDVKDVGEYVESLPGYDACWCHYMVSDEPILIRIGKQSDFPEFHV